MNNFSNKKIYLFKVGNDNIVTEKIVFNELFAQKKVDEWINDSGEEWLVSEEKVGGQYYPEYGPSFTAEVRPCFKKEHLWHLNDDRIWEPKLPRPIDGKKYQFCESCERWVESKCC